MPERRVTTGSPNPPRTFAAELLTGPEAVSAAPDSARCGIGSVIAGRVLSPPDSAAR